MVILYNAVLHIMVPLIFISIVAYYILWWIVESYKLIEEGERERRENVNSTWFNCTDIVLFVMYVYR